MLSMDTMEMITRWPTNTVSYDKCVASIGGIMVNVNILTMYRSDKIFNHISFIYLIFSGKSSLGQPVKHKLSGKPGLSLKRDLGEKQHFLQRFCIKTNQVFNSLLMETFLMFFFEHSKIDYTLLSCKC